MIDHRVCLTDDEIADRIIREQWAIERLRQQGQGIKSMVSYHSDDTGETHCLPIFFSDSMEDIVNRYSDFFPRELERTIDAVDAIKSNLLNEDAISKSKTMLASFKIPLGLYKMLEEWRQDFWEVEKGVWKNKSLINRLLSYANRFRIHA